MSDRVFPRWAALARGRTASASGLVGLAGFAALLGLVRAKRSDAFDLALTLKLQRWSHPRLADVMRVVSWPGFPPQSRIIPPTIIGALWLGRLRLEAGFQLLAWMTGLLSEALKTFTRRPRPVGGTDLRVVVAPLGGSSFPSGHVLTYVGTYGFLAYLAQTLLRPAALRRPIVAGLVGLLALVGPSRIHQGHHWPTDVTASYLLGISYLVGLTALYRRVRARVQPTPAT